MFTVLLSNIPDYTQDRTAHHPNVVILQDVIVMFLFIDT